MMILGIDTSNYTTSIALFDGTDIICKRHLLPVKEGYRGLRQSDALFNHIKQLPELFEDIYFGDKNIDAVSVSTSPRNTEGSYMPVFLAGENLGRSIASILNVPLYRFSHQEGHIMAGLYSANSYELLSRPFISVHLSGGTTEILYTNYNNGRFETEIIGKTLDISVGQLIDRVGVDLGFLFPCGKEVDALSTQSKNPILLPVSVKSADINFSGAETKCKEFYKVCDKSDICKGILLCIAKSLTKSINYCLNQYKTDSVLYVGGVASNTFLREYLKEYINAESVFASTELSTDNAVGTAILGYLKKQSEV